MNDEQDEVAERLEELRRLAADPRWGCSNHVAELLAELDRLRAESAEVARVHQEIVAVAAESLGSVKAELDRLRANVERFKAAIHSLSTRSLAPDRLADDIPDDPDEASTYALGRVGGAGCACGLWAKRDFPEFFATEGSE